MSASIDISRELQVAMATGKLSIGYKSVKDTVMSGRAKMVILAANAPPKIKNDLEYYAKLAGTPIFVFPGSSLELGAAVRKPFKISSIAVIDPGQSEILKLVGYA
ncbi:MAG: 50S ribosomal protein L30e [Thermoproteus sp.]